MIGALFYYLCCLKLSFIKMLLSCKVFIKFLGGQSRLHNSRLDNAHWDYIAEHVLRSKFEAWKGPLVPLRSGFCRTTIIPPSHTNATH